MPEPRYLESEHSGQDASERDHPESDCSKSAASKKDGSKSTNGDWPRPCITEIRYKFDKNNRERHVRPLIKFVFPDGETYYEPWNDEKVGCVEVEMDPHMNGVDWASRFPVKFISPTGFLVLPLGYTREQHIMVWLPDHEPKNVMAQPAHGQHLLGQYQDQPFPERPFPHQAFQGQALPNQLLPTQPAPGCPVQFSSGPGQYLHSRTPSRPLLPQNPQRFLAEAPRPQQFQGTVPFEMPTQLQAGPITPVSLDSNNIVDEEQARQVGYQQDRRPVHQVANQQVKSILLTSQYQQQDKGPSFASQPDQISYQQGGEAPHSTQAHQVDYQQGNDSLLDPLLQVWNFDPNIQFDEFGDQYNVGNVDIVDPSGVPGGELAP